MLANDLSFGSCILAFILVNYTPFDLGFKTCKFPPVVIVTTIFAQLFRSSGIMKLVMICYGVFKEHPSPYYPIPVFGPILNATLLGNMAGFVLKGLEGHVCNGVPWPAQNGTFTTIRDEPLDRISFSLLSVTAFRFLLRYILSFLRKRYKGANWSISSSDDSVPRLAWD